MRIRLLQLWLLTCVLAISGCGGTGKVVRPCDCPTLPPLPPNLMQPPETEKKVRDELFVPQPSATPKSEGSKTS